jgi:hypothetical protein
MLALDLDLAISERARQDEHAIVQELAGQEEGGFFNLVSWLLQHGLLS